LIIFIKGVCLSNIHILDLSAYWWSDPTVHAQIFFQSIHVRFSLAPCGNSTKLKYAHTDVFFSPFVTFFSYTSGQVET